MCKHRGLTTTLLASDLCSICGSLEGLCAARDLPAPSGSVGHDWVSGSVAPWRTRDGAATYATPPAVAHAAFLAVGLQRLGRSASFAAEEGADFIQGSAGDMSSSACTTRATVVVIDLGCGDASILRAAAFGFGAFGVGLDLDAGVLAEARAAVAAAGLEDRIWLRQADFTKLDLLMEVRRAAVWSGSSNGNNADIDPAPAAVVVTAFLLPDALQRLQPQLEAAVVQGGATLVTFKWDLAQRWRGPQPGERDCEGRFTVYRPLAGPNPRGLR